MRRGGGGGGGGMRDRRGGPTISLHVRGYDQVRTTAEALRAKFMKFGQILDVYMPRDYYTKKPRGFCYIEFENDAEADKAKEETDRTVREGTTRWRGVAREARRSAVVEPWRRSDRRDAWTRRRWLRRCAGGLALARGHTSAGVFAGVRGVAAEVS